MKAWSPFIACLVCKENQLLYYARIHGSSTKKNLETPKLQANRNSEVFCKHQGDSSHITPPTKIVVFTCFGACILNLFDSVCVILIYSLFPLSMRFSPISNLLPVSSNLKIYVAFIFHGKEEEIANSNFAKFLKEFSSLKDLKQASEFSRK